MRKVRTLMGLVKGQETLQVIENDLPNVAWKITRFRIIPKASNQLGALSLGARLCTDMRGLTAQAAVGSSNMDWESQQVLAISLIATPGPQVNVLDPENFVVQDLFVDNCTSLGVYYHIEMEMYSITSDEQIIYQLKQIGQDAE
tara:strand:- start:408 stop:839 length:432 start_codon:yes stop_codon:yes gene_type:complete